jgi:hypothetical protein
MPHPSCLPASVQLSFIAMLAEQPPALNAATTRFRFAWVLPLGALLLSALLLWPARLLILWELGIHLPPWLEQIMRISIGSWPGSLDFSRSAVPALNLPALLAQLPFVIFSASHTTPHPAGIETRLWNAVTSPLFCVPFWWASGRAMDALINLKKIQLTPRIGWPQTVIGFLLMVMGTVGFIGVLIGILFFSTHDDKTNIPNLMRVVAGCGLWAMLGGLSVIARFRQRRLLKKQKLPSATETSSLNPA